MSIRSLACFARPPAPPAALPPPFAQSATIKTLFKFPDLPPKKPESGAAEKELGWFDVLGGDNPVKNYRKMQEQREVQAWVWKGEGSAPGAGGVEGSVAREGAPFATPPLLVGAVGGKGNASVLAAAAGGVSGRPKAQQSKPQIVLHDVRPKASGNSSSKGKGKGTVRRPGKNRDKAQMI